MDFLSKLHYELLKAYRLNQLLQEAIAEIREPSNQDIIAKMHVSQNRKKLENQLHRIEKRIKIKGGQS